MKPKRIYCCNLLAIILTLFLLNGCVGATKGSIDSSTTLNSKPSNFKIYTNLEDNGESSPSNKSKTIVNNGLPDSFISDLLQQVIASVSGSFAYWGLVELSSAFEHDYTEEKLDQLLKDMYAILNAINKIDNKLNNVIYKEDIIIQKIDKSISCRVQDFLNNVMLGQIFKWNQFVNATSGETESQLAADPKALGYLKLVIDNNFLREIAINAAVLSGNEGNANKFLQVNSNTKFEKCSDTNGSNIDFISELTNAEQTVLQDKIYGNEKYVVGKNFDNLDPLLNNYNSNIAFLIIRCTTLLQQIYIIEQTALYLKYNSKDQDFNNLTLAEYGITNQNNYQQNKIILDKIFHDRAEHLADTLKKYIVSDINGFEPLYIFLNTIKEVPGYSDFINYVNIPSESSGNIIEYVWAGVTESGLYPFYGGISESSVLNAKVNNTNYQLNYLEDCVQLGNPPIQLPDKTKTVSFESSTNRLVCDNVDMGGTHYNGGGYISYGYNLENDDNKRGLKIYNTRDIMSSFTVQEGNITQDNNTVYWKTLDNSSDRHTVYGTVTFDYYLLTPSGKKDVYYDINFTQDLMTIRENPFQGERYYDYYIWDTTTSISCHANDPDCRQLAGKDDIDSGSGYSRICIDHHNIVLQDTHGDSLPSVEIKDYADSPC